MPSLLACVIFYIIKPHLEHARQQRQWTLVPNGSINSSDRSWNSLSKPSCIFLSGGWINFILPKRKWRSQVGRGCSSRRAATLAGRNPCTPVCEPGLYVQLCAPHGCLLGFWWGSSSGGVGGCGSSSGGGLIYAIWHTWAHLLPHKNKKSNDTIEALGWFNSGMPEHYSRQNKNVERSS